MYTQEEINKEKQKKNEEIRKMKFDICLMNPPFNLGVKMLTKWFDIANEICTVQPSTWLLGKKQKKDIVKNVDAWEKTEIESIQGNEHFDAAIGGVMAIQHFIRGTENNSHYVKQERIKFDGKWYKECGEISIVNNDKLLMKFKNIVEPLYIKDNLQNHLKYIPERAKAAHLLNCKFHNEYNPDPNKWYIYMPLFGGKDCYIYNKNISYNDILKYNDFINTDYKAYFSFINKNNIKNFVNYTKTYFCRICLWFKKTNLNLGRGELKYIPWFDFSNPIFSKSPSEIDDYLFKKYNISNEIRKHIGKILPDYYGIRKY